jgi:integral membrane protein
MKKFFTTRIGRLRLVGLLEGISLLVLLGIAMPKKYIWGDPTWVEFVGTAHGFLFLLFVINTMSVAIQYRWKFMQTTWKVLLACVVPFGTFYIDAVLLSKVQKGERV